MRARRHFPALSFGPRRFNREWDRDAYGLPAASESVAARIARLSAWPSSCGLNAFTKTLASTVYLRFFERVVRIGRRGARRAAAILSAHGGQETDAAHARTKSPLEPSSGAHESVPGGSSVFGRRRTVVSGLERKNHSDGSAAMRQDVRGSRLSHVTEDTSGMSLQLADADDLFRGSPSSDWVVPHVTTLRLRPLKTVNDVRQRGRCRSPHVCTCLRFRSTVQVSLMFPLRAIITGCTGPTARDTIRLQWCARR